MKTALVIGASGLVGTALVLQLAKDNYYSSVRLLVRKKIEISDKKIEQIIFDFENPLQDILVADDVYCCIGTTIGKAGSRDAFRRVDYLYPLETAKTALKNGAAKFALVSSMGASIKSSIFYIRVKGEIEESLSKLGFHALYIFRPSMLFGDRKESRFGEKIGKGVMTAFAFMIPAKYKGVHVDSVAAAMIAYMKSEKTGTHIIESDIIQNYKL